MREINTKDTQMLLVSLSSEINNKCIHIKAKKNEERIKNTFFVSCIVFLMIFIVQIFLRLLNVSLLTSFAVYQAIIMVVIVPLLCRSMKGARLNGKN